MSALARPRLGTTINVGVIGGGTHANVVAAGARAEIDVRFTTTDEARRIENDLRGLKPFDSRAKITLTGGINRPPMERTAAVAELFRKARGMAAALDFELGETSVGGFAAACGAAVLDGIGVDGDGAHAAHEHIFADAIVRRGALLAALVASL